VLLRYRRPADIPAIGDWRTMVIPLMVCVGYGAAAGLLSGLWIICGLAGIQPLLMLAWPPGVRVRMVIASTLLLAALWMFDQQSAWGDPGSEAAPTWWMFGAFAVILPMMSVLTLWWWDVLVSLDEARA